FLAWATYQLIEKKLRFRAGAERPLFAGCFVILLVGLAAWQGLFEPRHSSAQIKSVADAIADWDYPPPSFHSFEYDGARFYARKGVGSSVMFLGDSDIEQYGPRVEYLLSSAPESTKSALFATTGGCPPIPGVVLDRSKECQPRLAAATKLALTNDVDSVVIGACWYCYLYTDAQSTSVNDYYFSKDGKPYYLKTNAGADLAIESFARFVKSLADKKKVYVILSSPVGDGINPRYLLTGSRFGHLTYKETAGFTQAEFLAKFGAVNERLRKVASEAGATVIDPLPEMCKNGLCSALAEDGSPIYADGVHIRSSYVRKFASFIDPAVKAVR
ncbi:MAG TPA: SGNH hydrolase domain-containing protein, partial [Albitalea sp.]|nr:SGNH hydrolase domain-containing protein [Albitalea sp.]